jgi:competence protein ComEC
MTLPLVWVVVAFMVGILAGGRLAGPPWSWLVPALAAILAGLVCVWRRWLRPAWVLALLGWTLLGGLAVRLERAAISPDRADQLVAEGRLDTSAPLRWHGRLRSDPERLPWGRRYLIDLDEVEQAGRWMQVRGGLRLNSYLDQRSPEPSPEVRAGDRVEVLASAYASRNFMDPGAFDFRSYLARRDIYLTGTLRHPILLRRLSTPPLGVYYRLARFRGLLLARVDGLFGPAHAAVLRAMLLGDRNFINSALVTDFQKTATYHVLVIAGLHVAALAAFLFWLCRRLRLPLVPTTLVTLAVLGGYVAIVANRPPILRAALMAAAAFCARLLFRRVALLNAVAVAALVLLVAKPAELIDSSFQLSFLAAAVIAALALPWLERTSESYRRALRHLNDVARDGAHPPRAVQFRIDLRDAARWMAARLPAPVAQHSPRLLVAATNLGFWAWDLVALSLVIQFGLLPLLVLYFHRVSLSGPLANIPAVALTGLIVPLGFLALLGGLVWARVGALAGKLTGALVAALLATVEWFSRWSWLSYRIPGPPVWLVVLFFALLILLAYLAVQPPERPAEEGTPGRFDARARVSAPREPEGNKAGLTRQRWGWILAPALAAACLAVMTDPFPPRLPKGKLEVTVLDVGQGDSIFVAFPDGRTMLVDGGGQIGASWVGGYHTGLDIGEEVVAPYLWSRNVKHVDVVALTHAHEDHMDGLNAVLEDFSVGQLWVGHDVASRAYEALLERARAHAVPVVHLERGAGFRWDGVDGRVLWPADDAEVSRASNNDSLVLRLSDARVSFLLTGDIEKSVEKELTADGDPLAATFLKVPHHGSRTSSTEEFLEKVEPEAAAISVGAHNAFHQPSPEVLDRYQADHVRLWRTDLDGAISATSDGRTLEVESYAHPARVTLPPLAGPAGQR